MVFSQTWFPKPPPQQKEDGKRTFSSSWKLHSHSGQKVKKEERGKRIMKNGEKWQVLHCQGFMLHYFMTNPLICSWTILGWGKTQGFCPVRDSGNQSVTSEYLLCSINLSLFFSNCSHKCCTFFGTSQGIFNHWRGFLRWQWWLET